MKKIYLLIVLGALTLSCNDNDDASPAPAPVVNSATAFIGTYTMTSYCYPTNPQQVIIQSDALNSITISVGFGGSCAKFVDTAVTVSGNSILTSNFTEQDTCGNMWSIQISGILIGNDLSLTIVYTDQSGVITPCNFHGLRN